jgi:hypothetical protein
MRSRGRFRCGSNVGCGLDERSDGLAALFDMN